MNKHPENTNNQNASLEFFKHYLPQSMHVSRTLWEQIIIPYIGLQNISPALQRLQGTHASMTCLNELPCTAIRFGNNKKCIAKSVATNVRDFLNNVPRTNGKLPNFYLPESAFNSDGSLVARGSNTYYVCVNNAHTNKMVAQFLHDTQYVSHVAWNPTSTYLASSSFNKVRIWRLSDQRRIKEIKYDIDVNKLLFIDTNRIAAGLHNGHIVIHHLSQEEKKVVLYDEQQYLGITALAVNQKATHIASGSRQGLVLLWKLSDQSKIVSWPTQSTISALAFNNAGTHLAIGCQNGTVLIKNLHEPRYVVAITQTSPIKDVTFNGNDHYFATASNDGAYTLNISDGHCITLEQFIFLGLLEEYKHNYKLQKIVLCEMDKKYKMPKDFFKGIFQSFTYPLVQETLKNTYKLSDA